METPVPFSLMVFSKLVILNLLWRFIFATFLKFIVVVGIARKIASAGYGVFALDYPGFGLSEGLHGYIPSFDTLVDDVAEHFAKIKGIPSLYYCWVFMMSISMYGFGGFSWKVQFVSLPQ